MRKAATPRQKRLAMMLANNGGANLRQALFDGAPIALPLTHTAVPTRGSIVPTFTRATTETGQRWDEAGYLDFTALAGEIVFKGARREYNQWTTSSVTLANGGNKSLTLAAGTYQFSMGAGTGTATFSGTGGATGTLGASASARVSVAKTITAGTMVITASVADLIDLQVCNITGETDQTTIRPYVSVGVLSAPAYHGSMVDGVKCYDTDRSGNPIATSGSYPIVGYVPWEARTNIALQSEDWTTTWVDYGGVTTIASNFATAPNGTTTADKITATAAGANRYTRITTFAITAGQTYTQSCYFKYVNNQYVVLGDANDSAWHVATFDLINGTVASTAAASATITPTGNGWYRATCTYTRTNGGTATSGVGLAAVASNGAYPIFIPAGTEAALVWGSQVELGSFATPYIPTTTVAVARNADVLTYTGADVALLKTLACQFAYPAVVNAATNYTVIELDDGSLTSNSVVMRVQGTDLKLQTFTYSGTVNQSSMLHTNALSNANHKCAITWPTNGIISDVDGGDFKTDAVNTPPVGMTTLRVGNNATGSQHNNGPVNHIYGWTRQFSQSELGAVDA